MKKKIIVTEDDQDLLWMMVECLTNEGYEVLGLSDGTLIMEGHCQLPDLFVLDKEMDAVDGETITRYLKINPTTRGIPVLMVSGDENERSANEAGVDAFLAKPFHLSDLKMKIDDLFGETVKLQV